ncbi:MAG: hypothetical protein PHW76_00625 [Alphaproteobacteria bacterium]|nr:hypothetical protein [Alphaproteobacteria bacterium]
MPDELDTIFFGGVAAGGFVAGGGFPTGCGATSGVEESAAGDMSAIVGRTTGAEEDFESVGALGMAMPDGALEAEGEAPETASRTPTVSRKIFLRLVER